MISKRELEEAIRECESSPASSQTCQKLAALYTIYDHHYRQPIETREQVEEPIIAYKSDTEFSSVINGKNPEKVWAVMDELVDKVLQTINPRLYQSVLRKIEE